MNILTTEDARFIDREVPTQIGVSLEILMEMQDEALLMLYGDNMIYFP